MSIDRLFTTNPFDFSEENRQLFVSSFRQCAQAHYNGNELFKAFWDEAGIHPDNIVDEEALQKAPPIMVNLFKERELLSVPKETIELNLTSSGTSGQKSQIFLNGVSLERVKRSAYQIHKYLGITSEKKYNYLCFAYDPAVADDLGTAFTDELLTNFTGKQEVYYAIQWDDKKGEFALNRDGVVETLKRFAQSEYSTRILGFPAHLYKIINDYDLHFELGEDSWVQTGGGWKGMADEEIPKQAFREFIAGRLGIPIKNIRDLFGMVEHGIAYVDCEKGNLHIPNYSRVYSCAPQDLSILPPGENGLLRLMCSFNTSYPSINLLTTDWGRVGGTCDCGIGGQTLEITGRAGTVKHKGCAVTAAELLKD
ncbi:MAG: hypothetical protein GY757_49095 [bacterium]|nr:hypothetical protein [bacterium]